MNDFQQAMSERAELEAMPDLGIYCVDSWGHYVEFVSDDGTHVARCYGSDQHGSALYLIKHGPPADAEWKRLAGAML